MVLSYNNREQEFVLKGLTCAGKEPLYSGGGGGGGVIKPV